jgi:hypothetical protein
VGGRVNMASGQALGRPGEPHEPSGSWRGGYSVLDGTSGGGQVGGPTAVVEDVGLDVPPEGTVLGFPGPGELVRGGRGVSRGAARLPTGTHDQRAEAPEVLARLCGAVGRPTGQRATDARWAWATQRKGQRRVWEVKTSPNPLPRDDVNQLLGQVREEQDRHPRANIVGCLLIACDSVESDAARAARNELSLLSTWTRPSRYSTSPPNCSRPTAPPTGRELHKNEELRGWPPNRDCPARTGSLGSSARRTGTSCAPRTSRTCSSASARQADEGRSAPKASGQLQGFPGLFSAVTNAP